MALHNRGTLSHVRADYLYGSRARTLFILSTPATIALAQTVAIEKVDT